MLTVIVGLSGALLFGAADFLGGLASKRMSALRVTAVAATVGMVGLLAAIPFTGGVWSSQAVLFGALSGAFGAIAISLLYACLAIGPMSILSPLTAVISAVVPMIAGWLRGERLTSIGYLAIAIALVAVALVAFAPEKTTRLPSLKAVLMATGSGAAIGMFLIVIDLTPADSGLVPLVLNRAANAAIMFTTIGVLGLLRRRRRGRAARSAAASWAGQPGTGQPDTGRPDPGEFSEGWSSGWRIGLPTALACGIIDALGNALLLIGLRLGDLTVMSVLTALYPAGTIILATLALRERMAPIQILGLMLGVTASAMLTLA